MKIVEGGNCFQAVDNMLGKTAIPEIWGPLNGVCPALLLGTRDGVKAENSLTKLRKQDQTTGQLKSIVWGTRSGGLYRAGRAM